MIPVLLVIVSLSLSRALLESEAPRTKLYQGRIVAVEFTGTRRIKK
jgi:hypothetical protein